MLGTNLRRHMAFLSKFALFELFWQNQFQGLSYTAVSQGHIQKEGLTQNSLVRTQGPPHPPTASHILPVEFYWRAISQVGGTRIIFWWGVRPEVWNPLSISKEFSPSKNSWFYSFFKIFANHDPFLRVFLPQK